MCMAKAYLERDGDRELLLEDVVRIDGRATCLRVSNLFGDEKEVEAVVREVDFQTGTIVLGDPPPSDRSS